MTGTPIMDLQGLRYTIIGTLRYDGRRLVARIAGSQLFASLNASTRFGLALLAVAGLTLFATRFAGTEGPWSSADAMLAAAQDAPRVAVGAVSLDPARAVSVAGVVPPKLRMPRRLAKVRAHVAPGAPVRPQAASAVTATAAAPAAVAAQSGVVERDIAARAPVTAQSVQVPPAQPSPSVPAPSAALAAGMRIVAVPSSTLVLIASVVDGQQQVTPYQVGQALPSGAHILSVNVDAGTVLTDRGVVAVSH